MKRFWLVLLSLGLVLAFSASAMAVDVKFSGSFEAAGLYLDKTNFAKNMGSNGSTAFYYQTLKVNVDFIVAPGLKLVTSFDALDRVWGGSRSGVYSYDERSLGSRAESENIAFNLAYVSYASPIGLFEVGYIHDNSWGTVFGNSDINGHATGGIQYILPIGQAAFGAIIYKEADGSLDYNQGTNAADTDNDKYILFGMYNFNKDTNAGLLGSYSRIATYRQNGPFPDPLGLHGSGAPGLINLVTLQPYFKAKFGPVSLEGELWYGFGSVKYEDNTFGEDIQISNWQAYLNAKADFGMVYVGGTFAWVSGDNPGTTDKAEGGFLGGGADFQPCLMMFNNDLNYWSGMNPKGYGPLSGIGYDQGYGQYSAMSNGGMQNAWLYQLKAGVRPVAKLDVNASVTYAYADQKPFINGGIPYYGISQAATSYSNSDYGWEIDVVATYKITNNLSYMLGGAYWIVGNYFKGSNANFLGPHGSDVSTDLNNDYMVINKLTLTF